MLHWVIEMGMNRPLVGGCLSIWVGWALGEVFCGSRYRRFQVPSYPSTGYPGAPRLGFPMCSSTETLGPAVLSAIITVITPVPSGYRSGGRKRSTVVWWNLSISSWALGHDLPKRSILLPSQGRQRLEGLPWHNPSSRLGQSSGLSSGPLPPGEQPLLQRRLWTPSRGLLSPPSALATGIFLGSYRGEPGGAPGSKTQNSVGIPWHCGQQKLLTLKRVLGQAQSYVSIIRVLLPAHLPTCSCSRWADPGLTPLHPLSLQILKWLFVCSSLLNASWF